MLCGDKLARAMRATRAVKPLSVCGGVQALAAALRQVLVSLTACTHHVGG